MEFNYRDPQAPVGKEITPQCDIGEKAKDKTYSLLKLFVCFVVACLTAGAAFFGIYRDSGLAEYLSPAPTLKFDPVPTKISGRIMNGYRPLADQEICLYDKAGEIGSTKTNSNGEFDFLNIYKGHYYLSFSRESGMVMVAVEPDCSYLAVDVEDLVSVVVHHPRGLNMDLYLDDFPIFIYYNSVYMPSMRTGGGARVMGDEAGIKTALFVVPGMHAIECSEIRPLQSDIGEFVRNPFAAKPDRLKFEKWRNLISEKKNILRDESIYPLSGLRITKYEWPFCTIFKSDDVSSLLAIDAYVEGIPGITPDLSMTLKLESLDQDQPLVKKEYIGDVSQVSASEEKGSFELNMRDLGESRFFYSTLTISDKNTGKSILMASGVISKTEFAGELVIQPLPTNSLGYISHKVAAEIFNWNSKMWASRTVFDCGSHFREALRMSKIENEMINGDMKVSTNTDFRSKALGLEVFNFEGIPTLPDPLPEPFLLPSRDSIKFQKMAVNLVNQGQESGSLCGLSVDSFDKQGKPHRFACYLNKEGRLVLSKCTSEGMVRISEVSIPFFAEGEKHQIGLILGPDGIFAYVDGQFLTCFQVSSCEEVASDLYFKSASMMIGGLGNYTFDHPIILESESYR